MYHKVKITTGKAFFVYEVMLTIEQIRELDSLIDKFEAINALVEYKKTLA